ncbi:hypothetical protein Q8A67_025229 [Cirrhinus molitorella]|uniref:Uncharacterized protein n=1 Tax=Cirrhinus molitorella TaxID=172907 RepID=A0AA88NZT8_9TELE|nr:hypothetical protein Q8A67_025229 [Cirrhinus molitorella]
MSHVVLPASVDNPSEAGVTGRLQFNGPLTICLMSGPWPPSERDVRFSGDFWFSEPGEDQELTYERLICTKAPALHQVTFSMGSESQK